jgi:peptidoglycan/LPS O-acetylase OafA/YrhL
VALARSFNPALQGMRGVAILLVLLNHAAVPGFQGGFVGVDIFFVISGYLIGGLLLREFETRGGLDLWAFYARRVRRLLPAAGLVLLCALIGVRELYAPQEQDELLSSIRAAALYAANLWFASRPTDYFGGHTEANPTLHLWSLAVEEQFYLVWPLLMLCAVRLSRQAPRRATAWLLVVFGGLSFAACVVVSLLNFKYAFFLTPFRIWEFGVGMAVATWARLVAGWSTRAVSWLGLLALCCLAAVTLLFDGRMRFPGFWAALPVAAAALLLIVAQHGGQTLTGRLLQTRPIRWLGDCSYSVYLWHWPVLIAAALVVPKPDPWLTAGLVALSIALGWASYRLVEQPFMHALLLGWSSRRIVAAGLAFCLLIAATAQYVRSFVHVGPDSSAPRGGTSPSARAAWCLPRRWINRPASLGRSNRRRRSCSSATLTPRSGSCRLSNWRSSTTCAWWSLPNRHARRSTSASPCTPRWPNTGSARPGASACSSASGRSSPKPSCWPVRPVTASNRPVGRAA